jgi:catechol 2,3-dioxygenase-like lactoylglutathione lyase family enzyme
MIVGCNHICLKVADIEASCRFYCGQLGFQRGPEFRDEQGNVVGVYLYISQRMFLELFLTDKPLTPFSHYCLEVTDLEGLLARLRDAGVKTNDVFLGRSKALIASIWDPDGHHIELNEFSRPDSWMAQYLAAVTR